MRTLEMLSDSSLTKTVPRPWKADPSRRIARLRVSGLERAGIDRLKAGLVDRQALQRPAGRDHGRRRIRPHVALGGHAVAVRRDRLDPGHAGNGRELSRDAAPLGLDLDDE